MEQQNVSAVELSTSMLKVWMLKEQLIDEAVSSEHVWAFPVEIPLNGIIRDKDGIHHTINPFDEDPIKIKIESHKKAFYLSEQTCLQVCNAVNDRHEANAVKLRDDLMNRAETVDNVLVNFYSEIAGKNTTQVG